jgi:hypothetical protein
VKNGFRVRNGEMEIEYEGPLSEVNKRYEKALEWLTAQPQKQTGPEKKKEPSGTEKEDKRGGLRKAIYPPWIEKLKRVSSNQRSLLTK